MRKRNKIIYKQTYKIISEIRRILYGIAQNNYEIRRILFGIAQNNL